MSPAAEMDRAFEYLKTHAPALQERLLDFLRIPSISAQKDHAKDIRAAASWLLNACADAGLAAEIVETDGWPAVLAQSEPQADRPTILVYGHYDVQPEGDRSLWHAGPFTPTVRDGRIIGRGAADDKGQLLCALFAVEAWSRAVGRLPINVKLLFEGEEEVGSPNLLPLIQAHRDRLACDYIVIHDTGQFAEDVPAITVATKGLVYKEIVFRGPSKDLHSGSFGGAVANPANELCRLIASLKGADGKVNLPGFYDAVVEMSPVEVEAMNRLPFKERAFLEDVGSPTTQGELGYSTLHRMWARPTCDVNGLYGGYMKEGSSTIIPSFAGVKVSMRLVPHQKADPISRQFDQTVRDRVPPTVRCEIKTHANCDPYLADLSSKGMQAARQAVESGFGKAPVLIREGGSLPIIPQFKAVLGADSLLLGFAQPNCNAHSPNEFFLVKDFEAGMRTSAALIGLISDI